MRNGTVTSRRTPPTASVRCPRRPRARTGTRSWSPPRQRSRASERRERAEGDVRRAATRSGNGRMQLADLLVRRHQHEHAQPLADQTVHHVEEARETLADDRLRVRRQQLARVLENEQPPALFRRAVRRDEIRLEVVQRHRGRFAERGPTVRPRDGNPLIRPRLHEDVHQVVGVLAEERVRVDDVVEAAPVAPLPRERSQCEGLPRAGVAVPEHELPPVRGPEALHQTVERRARRSGVVRCDLVPFRNGDRPPGRHRPMR
jgi:hypothetical protein